MGAAVSGNRVHIPLLYSNEYLCGDRILNGHFEDEFALYPFESDLSEAELHKKAVSYAYTPTAMALPVGNGNMTECSFANVNADNKNVILTALYPEENHILARFCNFSDIEETIEFNIGKTKYETDLLGNELNAVTDKIAFKPWEIKTIKIEK